MDKILPKFELTGEFYNVEDFGILHYASLLEECKTDDLKLLIGTQAGGRTIYHVESFMSESQRKGSTIGIFFEGG